MAYSKYRRLRMMQEAMVAAKLFSRPSAFKFRPKWSLHAKRKARHKIVRREAAMSRKLFRKKSSFKFRPKWRSKKPTKRRNLGRFITTLSDGRKLYQYGATR